MRSTVVVLSYQPGEWLADCLASVADQADQTILVDNGSAGAVASDIGRAAGATVLRAGRNLGYAGGVNLGLCHAAGDVVALLNDDATAAPGWIDSAARLLAGDERTAAVTPRIRRAGWYREVVADSPFVRSVTVQGVEVVDRILGAGVQGLEPDPDGPGGVRRVTTPGRPFYLPLPDGDGGVEVRVDGEPRGPGPVCRLINKCGGYVRPDGVMGDYGDETPDDGRFDQPAQRFFASGTALVARADTFRRLGGLAEPFFAYYEDADWSWRARLGGMTILYDPTAVVVHRHSATSGGAANPLVRRLAERNRLLCLIRNAPFGVAAGAARRQWRQPSSEQGRLAMWRLVPWAVQSRLRLARHWETDPNSVWREWAGTDVSWDTRPTAAAG